MIALADGKINYIVECNPLLGPDLAEIIKTLDDGGTVEPRIVTKDEAFDQGRRSQAVCPTGSTEPTDRHPLPGGTSASPRAAPPCRYRETGADERSTMTDDSSSMPPQRPVPDRRDDGDLHHVPRASRRSTASTSGCSPARCTP